MPDINERRSAHGETRQWDGTAWRPVPAGPSSEPSTAGLFSGGLSMLDQKPNEPTSALTDLYHGITEHPMDTLKGFFRGGAEGLPAAAKVIQTTGPMIAAGLTGGASIPLQMAVGGGSQVAADLLGKAVGDPDAPQTFGDFIKRAGTGAAIPAAFAGTIRGAQAIGRGAPGAIDGALGLASHVPVVGKYAKVARVLRGIGSDAVAPEAQTGLQPVAAQIGPPAYKAPGYRSSEVPGSSFKPAGAPPPAAVPESPLPQSSMADVDRYMPNTPATSRLNSAMAVHEPMPQSSASQVDRYMPNSGGAAVESATPPRAARAAMTPEDVGRADVGSLRTGASLPNGAAHAIADLEQVPASGNGPGAYIDHSGQRMSETPFTFEAGDPNIPPSAGLEMKSNPLVDKVHAATEGLGNTKGNVTYPETDGPAYTDWATDIDDIVNQAATDNHPDIQRAGRSSQKGITSWFKRRGYQSDLVDTSGGNK